MAKLTEMYSPRKEAPVRTASPSPLRRGDQEPQGSGLSFAQVERFLAIPDRQKHGRSQPHDQIDVQVTVPPRVCHVYGDAHRSLNARLTDQ